MSKKELILFPILLVIFFAVAYQLIYGEQNKSLDRQWGEASVILPSKNDSKYVALKQGIEQAAIELGVNVTYVLLKEENNGEEQIQFLNREIENGILSILISVADSDTFDEYLTEFSHYVNIVTIESGAESNKVLELISADNQEMGITLVEKVLADGVVNKKIVISNGVRKNLSYFERCQAMYDTILNKSVSSEIYSVNQNSEDLLLSIEKDAKNNLESIYILPDSYSLELAAQFVSTNGYHNIKLYGFGSTSNITNFLEKGIISAMIVQNEYSIGYLGLMAAVNGINTKTSSTNIDFKLINSENMYDDEIQRLLFPYIR